MKNRNLIAVALIMGFVISDALPSPESAGKAMGESSSTVQSVIGRLDASGNDALNLVAAESAFHGRWR